MWWEETFYVASDLVVTGLLKGTQDQSTRDESFDDEPITTQHTGIQIIYPFFI